MWQKLCHNGHFAGREVCSTFVGLTSENGGEQGKGSDNRQSDTSFVPCASTADKSRHYG
jgi:hypothetical protein